MSMIQAVIQIEKKLANFGLGHIALPLATLTEQFEVMRAITKINHAYCIRLAPARGAHYVTRFKEEYNGLLYWSLYR